MTDSTPVVLTFDWWREHIIAEGIRSVEAHETGAKKRGALRGFDLCRELRTLDDFARELRELRLAEHFLSDGVYSGTVDSDRYWEHRYTTLQVEHCYARLRVMRLLLGFPEPAP